MRLRRTWLACLLVAALAGADESAAEKKASELSLRYRELRGEKGAKAGEKRFAILRSLGEYFTPRARTTLLKVVTSSRSYDERIIAVHSLGRIAGLEHVRALIGAVGKKPDPALTQALEDALAACPDPGLPAWLAHEGVQSRKPEIARACAAALVPRVTPQMLPSLRDALAAAKAPEVVHALLRAVGAAGGVEELISAATHPHVVPRLAAADLLPRLEPEHEAVRTLLNDPSPVVQRAAIRAVGAAQTESLIPALSTIELKAKRLRTRVAALAAILPMSARDPRPGVPPAFCRISLESDRVLFVLEVTSSMNWPYRRTPKRIEALRQQMKLLLTSLPVTTEFNLVLYGDKVRPWRKAGTAATEEAVAKAWKWFDKRTRKPEGRAGIHDALEHAFREHPDIDTIYFLTDDLPNHGRYVTPEGLTACVRAWNRHRRVALHAIAFTLQLEDVGLPILSESAFRSGKFVQALAKAGGGKSMVVDRAP